MKKIFTNKIFIISFIFFVLVLFKNSDVFATTYSLPSELPDGNYLQNRPGVVYISDNEIYYVVYTGSYEYLRVYDENVVWFSSACRIKLAQDGNVNGGYNTERYRYDESSSSWVYVSSSNYVQITLYLFDVYNNNSSTPFTLLSYFYVKDMPENALTTEHTVVFQGAPQQEGATQGTLVWQVGEILPKIQGIAMKILPVCLALFGTLLVVFLIKYKNLLHL